MSRGDGLCRSCVKLESRTAKSATSLGHIMVSPCVTTLPLLPGIATVRSIYETRCK